MSNVIRTNGPVKKIDPAKMFQIIAKMAEIGDKVDNLCDRVITSPYFNPSSSKNEKSNLDIL